MCSFGAAFAAAMSEAVLGALWPLWGTRPALQDRSSSCHAASAEAKGSFYPALMSQPLQGKEKEPVLRAGGIASTGTPWLCEQSDLSEPCRASPEECCKRQCSTKL